MSTLSVVNPRRHGSNAAVSVFERNLAVRRTDSRDRGGDALNEVRASSEILGRSSALRQVLHQAEMVAGIDVNVLILGESGTGKELIARAIQGVLDVRCRL